MRYRFAMLALLAPSVALSAQQARVTLDAGSSAVRYADSLDVTTASLTPAAVVTGRRGSAAVTASFSQLTGGAWSNSGSANATVTGPHLARLGTEVLASLGGSTHRDGTRTGQWLGMGQLVFDRSDRGAWAGGGLGGTWDGFTWRSVLQATAGGWLASGVGAAGVSLSPTAVDDTIRYTDLLLRLRRQSGAIELGGSLGARLGDPIPSLDEDVIWGSVSATMWVRPVLAIVAGAGTYPVDFTQGFPGGRFLSLALRVAIPSSRAVLFQQAGRSAAVLHGEARSFEIRRTAANTHRLRIHAPGARTAELAGDFTNWESLAMAPEANGWWSVVLPIGAGTYQLNVRFDSGPWRVPPGLVVIPDEFGGASGVLVVP